MRQSEVTKDIDAALAKAQAEFKVASKDAENPHFKSKYADLADVIEATRPALTKHAISIVQGAEVSTNGGWVLVTRMSHSSGQWYESDFPLLVRDQSPQAMGSAMTYAKRYSYSAMTGAVSGDEDDDGEAAQGRGAKPAALPKAKGETRQPPVNPDQVTADQLHQLSTVAKGSRYSKEMASQLVKEMFKVENAGKLTKKQCSQLIAHMLDNPMPDPAALPPEPGTFEAYDSSTVVDREPGEDD